MRFSDFQRFVTLFKSSRSVLVIREKEASNYIATQGVGMSAYKTYARADNAVVDIDTYDSGAHKSYRGIIRKWNLRKFRDEYGEWEVVIERLNYKGGYEVYLTINPIIGRSVEADIGGSVRLHRGDTIASKFAVARRMALLNSARTGRINGNVL